MNERLSESSVSSQSDTAVSLDAITLHSPDLLTVLDADGTIRYKSPSVNHLFGYDQTELLGEPIVDAIHPDDRQRVRDMFQTVVAAGEWTVESVQYRHETANGTYLWVESVGTSNPTPEGHYVVNTRDISDQKRREQELRKTNEHLEQFNQFLTHDLRNPLSVARGYLELAATDMSSKHHEQIQSALHRMETLIDELRADSTVDQLVVDDEPLKLDAVCETCWQHVSTTNATLQTAVDHRIIADRFRLMQLIENLFRNAVDHNEGGVMVTVGTLETGFYVADDGTGVPEPKREKMFEHGYSTAADGTGVGFDIISQVAEAHDWALSTAESSEGGLRVEITDVEMPSTDPGPSENSD